MKKKFLVLILLAFVACNKSVISKPDNLIDKGKMVDIIYDLSLLDAMKSQNPMYLEQHNINPRKYIYQKYKIDSLQFAKSNQYYATDLVEYKKLYDKVAKRLEDNKKKVETVMNKKGIQTPVNPDAPQIQ